MSRNESNIGEFYKLKNNGKVKCRGVIISEAGIRFGSEDVDNYNYETSEVCELHTGIIFKSMKYVRENYQLVKSIIDSAE